MDPDPSSMLIYKLLQLNCLAVYWQSDDSLLLGTSPPDNWTVCLCVCVRGACMMYASGSFDYTSSKVKPSFSPVQFFTELKWEVGGCPTVLIENCRG